MSGKTRCAAPTLAGRICQKTATQFIFFDRDQPKLGRFRCNEHWTRNEFENYGECVIHTGAMGVVRRVDRWTGKLISKTPAKFVYEDLMGASVPKGYWVAHICGKRECINPNHLICDLPARVFEMQYEQGIKIQKTHETHCGKGHKKSGNNLLISGNRHICRKCHREIARRVYYKKTGGKPREKRKHPAMHNKVDEAVTCKRGHLFTKQNTLVYYNSIDKRWNRLCRECSNKRGRIHWRRKNGQGGTFPKYEHEKEESYGI